MYLDLTKQTVRGAIATAQNKLKSGNDYKTSAAKAKNLVSIAKTLEEYLRAEIPSGEFFRVKCALKNHQMMILTQHPRNIAADREKIFAVLLEALDSIRDDLEPHLDLFLRYAGAKLPYAKKSREGTTQVPPGKLVHVPRDESFESVVNVPQSQTVFPLKLMLTSAVLITFVTFFGAIYVFSRPCVVGRCQAIQMAQRLQTSLKQINNRYKSSRHIVKLRKQLDAVNVVLQAVPFWSPHHQQAKKLTVELSEQLQQISTIVKAFEAASAATSNQIPAPSISELQRRQKLWRVAIARLETIHPHDQLYELVQPDIASFRHSLQTLNSLLLTEQKWLKKITTAQAVAIAAQKRQAAAKSLPDFLKVKSTWLVAVNTLNAVPQTSVGYKKAQKLLAEYKPQLVQSSDRASQELLAAKNFDLALNAAEKAKSYEEQNQLSAAHKNWQQAVTALKQIGSNTSYYEDALKLLEPLTISLKLTTEQLQIVTREQKAATSLEKTCTGIVRICHYTLNEREITVQITPEYEQTLQNTLVDAVNIRDSETFAEVNNHLQILQQALEAIASNANLPLQVYDSAGNVILSQSE